MRLTIFLRPRTLVKSISIGISTHSFSRTTTRLTQFISAPEYSRLDFYSSLANFFGGKFCVLGAYGMTSTYVLSTVQFKRAINLLEFALRTIWLVIFSQS